MAARIRSEGEARHTASLLTATLDATSDGILAVDKDGKVTTRNERFLEMWRIPHDLAQVGADGTLLAFILEQLEDPHAFLAKVRELYADPEAESFDILNFKDGRVFERDSRPQRVEGKSVGRVWSFRDITDARRASEALSMSEARLRAVIENASDVITITDRAGRYRFVSASVTHTLGYTPIELFGKRLFDFVHPEDAPRVQASIEDLAEGSESVSLNFRYLHKDGTWRDMESTRKNALDVPGIEGFVGIARDVTERRRFEREAQAHRDAAWRRERLSALGTLVAGVAHEINNPLTYVHGNLELAQMVAAEVASGAIDPKEGGDEVERLIKVALGGSERIGRITKALKTVGSQRQTTTRALVDLNGVVQNLVALLESNVPDNILLECALADQPVTVRADSAELHQVVLNLTKNAIESLSGKAGTVRLHVCKVGADASLTVTDDGPGIPVDVQANLFTPFYTTKIEGTGLGLSIIHTIVRDLGGDVGVESTPGAGATFRVRLPLAT